MVGGGRAPALTYTVCAAALDGTVMVRCDYDHAPSGYWVGSLLVFARLATKLRDISYRKDFIYSMASCEVQAKLGPGSSMMVLYHQGSLVFFCGRPLNERDGRFRLELKARTNGCRSGFGSGRRGRRCSKAKSSESDRAFRAFSDVARSEWGSRRCRGVFFRNPARSIAAATHSREHWNFRLGWPCTRPRATAAEQF